MNEMYSQQHRQLQDQHDTRNLADRVQELIVENQISEQHQPFIESRDFFFMTTIDHRGYPTCSYKVGNPKIGMLFIGFETPHRIRVHGEASIQEGDPLLSEYPGADMIVRVSISEIFVNCPRYIHRMQRIESSKYVPQTGKDTPIPQWKRIDAVQDALPTCEKGLAEKLGGTIMSEEYGEMVMKGEG